MIREAAPPRADDPRPAGLALGLVAAALLALAAVLVIGFWGFSYDDAFITYRYARNFAESGALVYNPGEHVLGTTAPGYALLLGGLAKVLPVSVPALGTLLSVASLLVFVLAGAAFTRQEAGHLRLALTLIFGLLVLTCRWNVELLGTETLPVAALGVAAAWLLLQSDKPFVAGLVAGAAAVLRLDALLLVAALGAVAWLRTRRFPLSFLGAAAVVVVPFLGWLYSWFATILPNTLSAKQAELSHSSYTRAELRWLLRTLTAPACWGLLALSAWQVAWGIASVVRRRARLAAPWLALALWLALNELAYRAAGVPFAPWYHVGAVNALLLLSAMGAADLAHRLATLLHGRLLGTTAQYLAALVLAAPLLVPAFRYVVHQFGSAPDPRYSGYRAAAEQIRPASPETSVAAVEIGFIGFFSPARVVDLLALVTPGSIQAKREGRLDQVILAELPDYVVDATNFRDTYLRTVEASPQIAALYERVADIPDGRNPSARVLVLRRKPALEAPPAR